MKKVIIVALSALCLTASHAEEKQPKAKVDCDAKYFRFRTGVAVFSNHPQQFHAVPEKFEGDKIMLLANGDNKSLEFEVKKAGTVTIIIEARLKSKLVAEGWEQVDHALLNPEVPRELPIMQKYLEEGLYTIPAMKMFGTRLIMH